MTKKETCLFSGHRNLFLRCHEHCYPKGPQQQLVILKIILEAALESAYFGGCRQFLFGGALGFDTLAAQTAITLRDAGRLPNIWLHLILPCRDQDQRWSIRNQQIYRDILTKADQITYVQENRDKNCMLRRDRVMADMASLGVFYHDGRKRGGTAYTYRYFSAQEGNRCRNLFMVEVLVIVALVGENWSGFNSNNSLLLFPGEHTPDILRSLSKSARIAWKQAGA